MNVNAQIIAFTPKPEKLKYKRHGNKDCIFIKETKPSLSGGLVGCLAAPPEVPFTSTAT
ncbi:MAG: hypothetical protein WC009_09245 [Methylotenera sp.]